MQLQKFLFILILCSPFVASGQVDKVDSLKALLKESKKDIGRVRILNELSNSIFATAPGEAISYGTQAKKLAFELKDSVGLAYALKNIGLGYYIHGNYIEVSINWEESLAIFEALHDDLGSANLLSNLGVVYSDQGDDAKAIEYYLRSLRLSEKVGDSLRIATALGNIGHVYAAKEATREKSLGYFMDALKIGESVSDPDIIGTSASNIGDVYFLKQQYDSALIYLEKSLNALVNTADASPTLNLIGKVYASIGNYDLAEYYQKQAIDISTSFNANFDLSEALLGLGNTYEQKGKYNQAISVYLKAQKIAVDVGANYILKDVYEGLANSYSSTSDFKNAFFYQKQFDVVKDSVYNTETDDKIKTLQFSYELDKKEDQIEILEQNAEIESLKAKRQEITIYSGIVMVFLLAVLGLGLFQRFKYVQRTNKIIENEKDRSENLLLNILPESIARELKEKGSAISRDYERVSILFTDFKSFTQLSAKLSAQVLVAEINECFKAFDAIMDKYRIEKIKTIGDAYMAAGGLPLPFADSAKNTVLAALEMQNFIEQRKQKNDSLGLPAFEMRAGIHTGHVVAGIVGVKKFQYDIWGDAVNTASRLESNGQVGKVNISKSTYELIKDDKAFVFESRGKVDTKGKGELEMYFAGRNEEFVLKIEKVLENQ